jgi:hypothetical protein
MTASTDLPAKYVSWNPSTVPPNPPPKEKGKKMGNLNICEREGCNAITKGNAAAFIEVTINGNASSVSMSLCPACMTEVDHMLHTAPIIERARSYDKPYTGWKEPVSDDLAAMTTEQLAAELFQRTMKQAQQAIESGK